MLFRFYYLSNRFFSTIISRSKAMYTNKCYFRYIQQEDKVDISLLLEVKGSMRQFNFSRKSSESLQDLLGRIKTNIEKVMNKGIKNKMSKENYGCNIEFYDGKNEIINEKSTCKELFTMSGPVKLKLSDNTYEVVFNPPWVLRVNLPESILAGFPVYPEHFETQYIIHEKCIFKWYKGCVSNDTGKAPNDQHSLWELTGNNFVYTPNAQDIGMKLKLECIPGKYHLKLTYI